jgi:hypothetical protein
MQKVFVQLIILKQLMDFGLPVFNVIELLNVDNLIIKLMNIKYQVLGG